MGRLSVHARQPKGLFPRALGAQAGLPALVQPRPPHGDARNSCGLQTWGLTAGRGHMSYAFRLERSARIDMSKPLSFTFNGRPLTGYAGDTLASALLANGVHLVARSIKYHRPRGLLSSGNEEPNALV